MSNLGQIKQVYPVPAAERKGQVLVRARTSGAAFVGLNAALNHKATHRKSLWSQPYTKLAPNLPDFSPFSSENINGNINIKIFFSLPAGCTCYIRESLPNSFIQTVSQICGAENLTAERKDMGGKRHRDIFPGEA